MSASGMRRRITHSFTDDTAVIRLEGLAKPLRMLHLTDTHLRFFDERDGEKFHGCVDYTERIEKLHRERGTQSDPEKPFRQTMAQGATEDLDLLALTGDIIHFPSPASVEVIDPREASVYGNVDAAASEVPGALTPWPVSELSSHATSGLPISVLASRWSHR